MSRIAILVGDGYEDSEFEVPLKCMRDDGTHEVVVIGTQPGGTVHGKRGQSEARIECGSAQVTPEEFDALIIPGGHGPDKLRLDADAVSFAQRFVQSGKPVSAICHGPQLLIEAEVVEGRTMTSWPSVRKDLINAGATWMDRTVVEDGNLITSRKPDDLDQFCETLLRRV